MSNIEQKIEYLPTDCIFPHPQNPRKDLGDLTELADSIRQNGILQNLTVVEDGDTYTVLIGHRRLAAAKLAGLEKVPCVVASMSGKEQIRLLDKIGTNNFRNALEREMAEERKKALKAYYIAEISKFAKEYTGDDIYKDYQWKTRFMLFGKKEEIIPPVDANTTEYVYMADNYGVSLFVKKTDSSSTKCIDAYKAEQEERRQRREKEENRLNALKEAATRAVSLRRGFVETVGVRAIRANMKKIVAALVFLVFDDTFEIYQTSENMALFGIAGDEVTWEAVAQAITAPERPLLKLAYESMEEAGEEAGSVGYFNWRGEYEENECLDHLYDLLEALGYQMSDEEKALRDGTHELYAVESDE